MDKHELLSLVRELEWSGVTDAADFIGFVPACPWCGAAQEDGQHGIGCRLAQAIEDGDRQASRRLPDARSPRPGDVPCAT